MSPIIEIKNVSKKYNIQHRLGGYVALRDVLTNIAKSPFKFFKHKAKQVLGKEVKEDFWALKNINLEIAQGEVIGIIGPNGAGKSTLLKILSKITPPTEGEIRLRGRVGSLLEVGTGFHPELTGRENIFLNGAILGMTKKEIVSKFDEIVDFAGIEKFLDTPVKYYSSGMYVRLAFSVAAHLEPDILIIDEVLAVGDAEFQKKCLGKMDEITKTDGRTILFVSHNLSAIEILCPKTILLNHGKVEMFGETKSVVKSYFETISKHAGDTPLADRKRIRKASLRAKIIDIKMAGAGDQNNLKSDAPAKIKLKIESYGKNVETSIQIIISDEFQNLIYIDSVMRNKFFTLKKGLNEIECEVKALNLFSGNYKINCYLTIPNKEIIDYIQDALFFSINSFDPFKNGYNQTKDSGSGYFYLEHSWSGDNLNQT